MSGRRKQCLMCGKSKAYCICNTRIRICNNVIVQSPGISLSPLSIVGRVDSGCDQLPTSSNVTPVKRIRFVSDIDGIDNAVIVNDQYTTLSVSSQRKRKFRNLHSHVKMFKYNVLVR